MADIETLRLFVNERLTAVAEDILAVFVRTLVQYQQHPATEPWTHRTLVQYQQHMELQQRRHMDLMDAPIRTHGSVSVPLDPFGKDELSPGQQERSPGPLQEEQESAQIKEEQEFLQRPEEADGSSLPLLAVKAEGGEDNAETELPASSSAASEHMKTHAFYVDDCGGASQPASDVQLLSSNCSESDTEDSDVWGEETREDQTAVNTVRSHKTQHGEGQGLFMSDNDLSQELTSTKQTPYMSSSPGLDTPFKCNICGKVFGKTYNLKTHMMTHTGEKPFSCTVCGKLFNHRGGLNRHMIIHTGEKRFSCAVCGKGFGLNANLKTHMRSHTGEKPFSCLICGKGFSVFANLKRHITTHTGEMIM